MYCRNCNYDLRGQIDPRCPECGLGFDPGDDGTFLDRLPSQFRRKLGLDDGRLLGRFVLGLVIYLMIAMPFLWPMYTTSRCGPLRGEQFSRSNLYGILNAWLVHAHYHPRDKGFSWDKIKRNLKPYWYSRSVNMQYERSIRWGRTTERFVNYALLLLGLCVVVAAITRPGLRGYAIVASLLCICAIAVVWIFLTVQGAFMNKPTLKYVEDFIYVEDSDGPGPDAGDMNRLIAFEKEPWPSGRRNVARPYEVKSITESEFQKLLSEQPAARRAWENYLQDATNSSPQ